MLKLLTWLLLLAGLTLPILLSVASFRIHRATRKIDNRYNVDSVFGTDSKSSDRTACVEILGHQISINPNLFPAALILFGSVVLTIGLMLMLHASQGGLGPD